MTKTSTSCDWVPSFVAEEMPDDYVKTGILSSKNIIQWRVPNPDEARAQRKENEVIVFADHINRGFSPPGSKFFRDVLHFFNSIPKILDPITFQISAISKSSAKCIFKKNPTFNSSESIIT